MPRKSFYLNFSKDELQKIINESTSIREVLLKCGLNGGGGSHAKFSRYLQQNNFDTSTLVGRSIGRHVSDRKTPSHLIKALVENGTCNSSKLKKRLFLYGVKEKKCEVCGITHWNNEELVMELHHINGIHTDNRLENLIILCPNCHSQTHNFRGKNSQIENEKEKYNKLIEIAKKDASIKLPKLIEDAIKTNNAPKRYQFTQPLKTKQFNKCCVCGNETLNDKYCSVDCYNKHLSRNKVTSDKLLELSKKVHSISELNRLLNIGVTDNAIKKWCNQYGIYQQVKKNFIPRTYPIIQYDMEGNLLREWENADIIKKELGYNKVKIQACCRGAQKSSFGFKWRYKEDVQQTT